MQNIAAIDVGSNAMRLVIGRLDYDNKLETCYFENLRLPVRLGHDAFSYGQIREETSQQAVDAFMRFRKVADDYEVGKIRAVATSAMREAANSNILCDRIFRATGIEVEVISGEEEARLIHLAVSHAVNLRDRYAMMIDIGGGSVEVTFSKGRNILSSESYRMGTVRLLQKLDRQASALHFDELVGEYAAATRGRIKQEIGGRKVELCIGTGGNVEEMGTLRRKYFKRDSDQAITLDELDRLIAALRPMTVEERMLKFKLKPDRADVILPAAIVLKIIAQEGRVKEVKIPRVGLKEGILIDLARHTTGGPRFGSREQIWTSAVRLGEKYRFEAAHGNLVSNLAARLFDRTHALHNLDAESRLLLEVAALLHDIGHFINTLDHDKHGYYVLQANPLIGLNKRQQDIVANVVRYHRKAMPGIQDENFRALSSRDRLVVIKLAALLRLADAMDVSHTRRVKDVTMRQSGNRWRLRLECEGGGSLETWSLQKRRALFQDVFGVQLEIET